MKDPRLVACDESPAYLTAMDEAAERFFEYEYFLRSKMITTAQFGIAIDPAEITTHFLEAAACDTAATSEVLIAQTKTSIFQMVS